jgi:4-hydroxybenzoyl-CoA thioesterase
MSRVHTSRFVVEFGDCDPAQIVFYPNYLRWMDAASLHFFRAAGVPPWRELEAQTGIIGTPIVDVAAKFLRPASYGDAIEIDTSITEWRGKSFVLAHRIRRGDDVLVEGREVRIFARRHPTDPARIEAVPAPANLRELCA